ncbi:hypothetical protein GCM10008090_33390 [Arenicella chitinivorans]|uniref:DUF2182 domain-containing protein n=1 Tax=Arenicella chitinivorans TaxID=1329800 RepID=A0A918S4B8_9GAMM|nr:DUF2182 domain-containing protein [Arenicella chitinivorans]GHA20777.1 hypothetical protein GCM10008090_33390 [Arenicella chitinivorans]
MTDVIQTRRRISCGVLCLSAVAWVYLTLWSRTDPVEFTGATESLAGAMCINGVLIAQSGFTSPLTLLTGASMFGWAIMIVAMMFPTLIAPLTHLAQRSFRNKRAALIALFLMTYLYLWILAGTLLLFGARALRQAFSDTPAGLIMLVLTLALVWQCSPSKQQCLNRNHLHPALRAYGIGSYLDAVRFGLWHGFWCVGSCWALMLLSTVFVVAHQPVMLLLTFIMLTESMQVPTKPAWEWRLVPSRKLRRLVAP